MGLEVMRAFLAAAVWMVMLSSNASANLTYYKYANVDGLKIFYREAVDSKQPTILLLHGFPTSSHMFRDLIPLAVGPLSRVASGKSANGRIMADLIWDIPSAVRSYP